MIFVALAPFCAVLASFGGVPPEFAVLRLPTAVSIEGTGYNNGASEPFERLKAKVGESWTAGTQEIWEGDLGFVPKTIVHGEDSLSLRVELARSTGVKDDWFKVARVSIIDPLVSPMGWMRFADTAAEQGVLKSRMTDTGLAAAFDVSLGAYGTQCVDIEWSSTPEVLLVKAGRTRTGRAEYTYSSWKALPGGVRHPTDIAVFYPGEPEPFRKHVLIDVLSIHPASPPAVPRFVNSVRIREDATGRTLDGELRPVDNQTIGGPVPQPSSVPKSSALSPVRSLSWLKVAGSATAVIAVVIGVIAARRVFKRD